VNCASENKASGICRISSRAVSILAAAVIFVAAGFYLWLVYSYDPSRVHIIPPCIFHTVTGLYCPGCGSTRAMHALLHGDIVRALGFNLLAVVAMPFIAGAIILSFIRNFTSWHVPKLDLGSRFSLFVLVLIMVFWVTRNIPVYPFTLLAP